MANGSSTACGAPSVVDQLERCLLDIHRVGDAVVRLEFNGAVAREHAAGTAGERIIRVTAVVWMPSDFCMKLIRSATVVEFVIFSCLVGKSRPPSAPLLPVN